MIIIIPFGLLIITFGIYGYYKIKAKNHYLPGLQPNSMQLIKNAIEREQYKFDNEQINLDLNSLDASNKSYEDLLNDKSIKTIDLTQ